MNLDYKRIKAELARVQAARYDQEFKQEELRQMAKRHLESANRLDKEIEIQLAKEKELEIKLKENE